jgi:hypothetical protein
MGLRLRAGSLLIAQSSSAIAALSSTPVFGFVLSSISSPLVAVSLTRAEEISLWSEPGIRTRCGRAGWA